MRTRTRTHPFVRVVVVLAALAFGLWLVRDQPRSRVERALTKRFDSKVTVGDITVLGRQRVQLHDVTLTSFAGGALRTLSVETTIAEGPLTEMLDGRFRSLTLDGVRSDLQLCDGETANDASAPSTVIIGELSINNAVIRVACGAWSISVTSSGRFTDIGGTPHGRLELHSGAIQSAPFNGVPIATDSVDGELNLATGGHVSAKVAARHTRFMGPRELPIGDLQLQLDLQPRQNGEWHLSATSDAPLLGSPQVEATLEPTPWHLRGLTLRANSVQAGALCTALAPIPGLELGEADFTLTGDTDDRLQITASLTPFEIVIGGQPLRGSSVMVRGEIVPSITAPSGRLQADLLLDAARATTDRLAAVLPVKATVGLLLPPARPDRLEINAQLRSDSFGELSGRGQVDLAAPHAMSLEWQLGKRPVTQLVTALGGDLPPTLRLSGSVSSRGRLEGDWRALHGHARIEGSSLELGDGTDGTWQAGAPAAGIDLRWDGSEEIHAVLKPFRTLATAPTGTEFEAEIYGETTVNLSSRQLKASNISADLRDLGILRATADSGMTNWRLGVTVPELGPWLAMAPHVADVLAAGQKLTGNLSFEGPLTLDLPSMTSHGHLELHDLGWASNDGARVIQGMQGRGQLSIEVSADGRAVVQVDGRLGRFQLLWDVLYGDYSTIDLAVSGDASWHNSTDWSCHGRAMLGQTLDVNVEAQANPTTFRWQATLGTPDLGLLWNDLVKQPCSGSLGAVETLFLDGGVVSLHAEGSVGSTTELKLRTLATGLGLSIGDQFVVDGLGLDLPTTLRWSGERLLTSSERHGELSFSSLTLGGLDLPPTSSTLIVRGDQLRIADTIAIPVAGGSLRFDNLGLIDALSQTRHLEGALSVDGLDLERLTTAFGLPRLEGRLEGLFPHIRLSPELLSVDGASELEVFGGSLILSDFSIQEPLSRYPHPNLSMAWEDIDLGRLTSTFDFGRITGVVEGEIEHCELFRGLPVRCSVWLRSTPVDGIKQRISLKAVNNIAILGTGSGLGLIDRGIHRLIDSYSYESLGFSMQLADDHFLLNGLSHRGNRELFVKGRLPLRLDVVNAMPGTTVSFRSMVERLRYLDFSAVRTEH